MKNLEVRAGMQPGLNNTLVGYFKGPGITNVPIVIIFNETVTAQYLSFQLKLKKKDVLIINGIRLNLNSSIGKLM